MRDLREALRLPPWVVVTAMPVSGAEAELARFQDAAPRWRAGGWTAWSDGMGDGRRREFIAGRLCALRALAASGAPSGGCLPRDVDGLPVWPSGWVGCISHSQDWAVAAAAPSSQVRGLGIDIQELVDDNVVGMTESMVASPEEMRRLRRAMDRRQAFTLLFSAKEALYKALYPGLRRFQDFDAACVVGVEDGVIELALTRSWDAYRWLAGVRVRLNYTWRGDVVATSMMDAAAGGDSAAKAHFHWPDDRALPPCAPGARPDRVIA